MNYCELTTRSRVNVRDRGNMPIAEIEARGDAPIDFRILLNIGKIKGGEHIN